MTGERRDQAIVHLADEIEAGLIIIGSRGLGGLRRALMGSVSDSAVHEQRYREDDHAEEPQDTLRHRAEQVADQNAARCPRGSLPGSTPAPGASYAPLFTGRRGSPATPEILAGEDATDSAAQEAEEGPNAEEQGAGQGTDEAAYGSANGTPVARPETPRAVGRAREVRDEGEEGEETKEDQN
jgi:hypothetical protein